MDASATPPTMIPRFGDRGSSGLSGFYDDDRERWASMLVGLLLAIFVHGALATSAGQAPPKKLSERVEMAIYKPPPPPPPPEPPPPPPPEPEKPKPKPPPPIAKLEEPPPPPPNQEPPPELPPEPVPIVTGLTLESTVQGNSGFQARVGNTTFGDPNKEKFVDPKDVKPYAGGSKDFKAARNSSLTREARVLKDYKAPYPRDLADQGIEGSVVLLVEITSAGAVRNARVAKSSGNSTLDRLAQEAIKRFRFAPAEVEGQPSDSILRYTYRFELFD
jgi:periplasmic protein TonB